jgi:hypothetical protein
MYFHNVTGPATLNFYEDQNVDWSETAVNWNNAPTFGTVPLTSLDLSAASRNKWLDVDISSYYTLALSQGKTFMNIGASIVADQTVGFRTKEFDSGKFKSRLILTSPPVSIISPEIVTAIAVPLDSKIKTITLDELKFKGTVDKNISYTIQSLPQKGFLVLNGLPLTVNASFTQEQIAKGVLKYLYNGTSATTDTFSVEAKDFQGGIYNTIVNMTVNIL